MNVQRDWDSVAAPGGPSGLRLSLNLIRALVLPTVRLPTLVWSYPLRLSTNKPLCITLQYFFQSILILQRWVRGGFLPPSGAGIDPFQIQFVFLVHLLSFFSGFSFPCYGWIPWLFCPQNMEDGPSLRSLFAILLFNRTGFFRNGRYCTVKSNADMVSLYRSNRPFR